MLFLNQLLTILLGWALPAFGVETFVMPTGAMAETLWGAHQQIGCPQCQWRFAINDSRALGPEPEKAVGCTCPNCRFEIDFAREKLAPVTTSGDRFLVPKWPTSGAERFGLIVFDFPAAPPRPGRPPIRYIKRVAGLPGETVALQGGEVFVGRGIKYARNEAERPEDAWKPEHMLEDDVVALRAFKDGKFQIARKSPAQVLAQRRLVHDNDFQARDLSGKQPPRWSAEKQEDWIPDDAAAPRQFSRPARAGKEMAWLRYRHLLRGADKPSLITDFSGYNTSKYGREGMERRNGGNWVGDLMLECTAGTDKADGEVWLELQHGADRFQARVHLATGACTLVRLRGAAEKILHRSQTAIGAGETRLRFANVDRRLVLWVNGELPFEDGIAYEPVRPGIPTKDDLQPAAVGVRGAGLTISHLRLWRDTYVTARVDGLGGDVDLKAEDWSDSTAWGVFQDLPVKTYFVQPGHWFVLGDNSTNSADSRYWGLVPQRLLLGPAVLTYWPPARLGRLH